MAALRARGIHVQTLSIRRPHSQEAVSVEVRAEAARTTDLPETPDRAAVDSLLRIVGHEHRRHSATADFLLDAIAVG